MEERDFLIGDLDLPDPPDHVPLTEMKIVNETQADLGLTAIPSSSVLDIMCNVR